MSLGVLIGLFIGVPFGFLFRGLAIAAARVSPEVPGARVVVRRCLDERLDINPALRRRS